MNGIAPSMTAGGHSGFFAAANMVDSNVYEKFASCPLGSVTQLSGGPHGNYAVYGCANGQVFMSYVGGR